MRPDRRTFLQRGAALALGLAGRTVADWAAECGTMAKPTSEGITLFLCGDLMLGRGIDQVLPNPGDPQLYEPYVHSALGYLALAERATGPIPRSVDLAYVWGDAPEELATRHPSLCIVNLETAVTAGGKPWPGKGIHYQLHPGNAPCLKAARVDCCVLANNHVLDWGYQIPAEHRRFAQALIDRASVDLVHGHSSHHPKGIEVHGGRLVLYGCGDFLNDYEGISGYEAFRGDLSLMYFVTLDPAGRLRRLEMVPMQIRRFRLQRAAPADSRWLQEVLDREGRGLGTGVGPAKDGSLSLRW